MKTGEEDNEMEIDASKLTHKELNRDSVGYRAALHMKEYLGKKPVLVIGGTAQEKDKEILKKYVGDFVNYFNHDIDRDKKDILKEVFTKLLPLSKRPYGRIYAY